MATPQQITDAMTLPPDKHYASADKPVNRRTALREQLTGPQQDNPLLRQRLQNAQARQLLGTPLAVQLSTPPRPVNNARYALMGIAPVAVAAAVWIMAQLPGLPALLAGAGISVSGIAAGLWAWRKGHLQDNANSAQPVFAARDITRLDQVLEQLAPLVPADILARLLTLKTALLRITPLLSQATASAGFTLDDRHFIIECVRRYLPDTLQAYLEIPAPVRDAGTTEEPSPAQASLGEQLDLLQAELGRREALLAHGASERLQQQQRFLEAKQR